MPDTKPFRTADIVVRNRRRQLDMNVVRQIAADIETVKHSPITVRMEGDIPILVTGNHRLEAHKMRGIETIDCFVFAGDAAAADLLEVVENLHRSDLKALERNEHIAASVRLRKLSAPPSEGQQDQGQRKAADALGIDEKAVRVAMKIDALTPEAKVAARETGLDDNQVALLEATKSPPQKQAKTIRHLAAKRRKKVARKPSEGKAAIPAPGAPEPAATASTESDDLLGDVSPEPGSLFDEPPLESDDDVLDEESREVPPEETPLPDRSPEIKSATKPLIDILQVWSGRVLIDNIRDVERVDLDEVFRRPLDLVLLDCVVGDHEKWMVGLRQRIDKALGKEPSTEPRQPAGKPTAAILERHRGAEVAALFTNEFAGSRLAALSDAVWELLLLSIDNGFVPQNDYCPKSNDGKRVSLRLLFPGATKNRKGWFSQFQLGDPGKLQKARDVIMPLAIRNGDVIRKEPDKLEELYNALQTDPTIFKCERDPTSPGWGQLYVTSPDWGQLYMLRVRCAAA